MQARQAEIHAWACAISASRQTALSPIPRGGADFAENFVVEDGTTLTPGDIAAIDENGKATLASSTENSVAGVVSETAGFIGNLLDANAGANHAVIGLMGQIPMRVSIEGGAIRPGDPISLSSVPGVGKKAASGDRVIGTAIGALDTTTVDALPCEMRSGAKVCLIMVLVNAGWGMLPAVPGSGLNVTPNSHAQISSDSFPALLVNTLASLTNHVVAAGQWMFDTITAHFVKTDVIEAKNAIIENGITVRDRTNGKYYCATSVNGQWAEIEGTCGQPVPDGGSASSLPAASDNVPSSGPISASTSTAASMILINTASSTNQNTSPTSTPLTSANSSST
jgi:hypothetical protein